MLISSPHNASMNTRASSQDVATSTINETLHGVNDSALIANTSDHSSKPSERGSKSVDIQERDHEETASTKSRKKTILEFTNKDLLWCLKKRDLFVEPSITSNSYEWRENASKIDLLDLLPEKSLRTEWKSRDCGDLAQRADAHITEMEEMYRGKIANFTHSSENRVISFGLYGNATKYCTGAVRNAELSLIYFPGWKCRFYITKDVPAEIVSRLKELKAELIYVKERSMFSRFLVASDKTVDRYIVRDADSRLNARDSLAVQDWIESNMTLHSVRDHTNHCNGINGGMWGGTSTIPNESYCLSLFVIMQS